MWASQAANSWSTELCSGRGNSTPRPRASSLDLWSSLGVEGVTYLVAYRRASETCRGVPCYHLYITLNAAVCRRLYFYTTELGRFTQSRGRQPSECALFRGKSRREWRTGGARGAAPPTRRVPCPARRPRALCTLQPPHGFGADNTVATNSAGRAVLTRPVSAPRRGSLTAPQ